jgi:hypothetical protein
MNPFSVGDRVELKSCTGFLGTVTGFTRGSVLVAFDDLCNEPPKAFPQTSLQIAERQQGSRRIV